MDIGKILGEIKGKVLDAAHFELLQNAYELQRQNIEQLKENNAAIKEKSSLLNEKAEHLSKENEELKARIEELEAQIQKVTSSTEPNSLSEVATTILKKCIERDVTDFYVNQMIDELPYSRMESEIAIDELKELKLIRLSSAGSNGVNYRVTNAGKKFALGMSQE